MTPRARLAVALAALPALALNLAGPRVAAAATSAHAHRAPAHEPIAGPYLHRVHRRTSRAPHHRLLHAGGLLLAVGLPGQKAHAAADPGASIVDYSFSPPSITIHVGDTITWTNVGKAPHSATADNHSFDTGVLQHGQSGSHTFTTPGTYTYFCIVHPYMKGTIVVLANAPATTSTTPASTTPTPTTTPSTSSAPGLPNTGLDLLAVVGFGAGLAGLGLALRRRLS